MILKQYRQANEAGCWPCTVVVVCDSSGRKLRLWAQVKGMLYLLCMMRRWLNGQTMWGGCGAIFSPNQTFEVFS